MTVHFVSGIGKLHILMAAKVFKEQNPSSHVVVWTTIVPKLWQIRALKTLGLTSLARRLEDRLFDLQIVDACFSEPVSEILCFLFKKIFPSEFALGVSFRVFSFLISNRILKHSHSRDTVIFRSGSGTKIKELQRKGIRVLVDHSIAHPNYFRKIQPYLKNPKTEFVENSILWRKVIKDCAEANEIMTISEYVRDSFPSSFKKHKFYVLPLPVDKRPIISDRKFSNYDILFVGHFNRRKGSDIFLLIAEYFLQFEQYRFKIIGELHDDVDWALKLPNVETLGLLPKEDVEIEMSRARALLFPTRLEGGAKVIQEAWQSGLPVITTYDCACPISSDNAIEIVLPPSEDFFDKMSATLNDEHKLIALSDAGKKTANSRYLPSIYSKTLNDILRR